MQPYQKITLTFIAVLATAMAGAQFNSEIRGTILDASGGRVPGASVRAKSPALQLARTVESDAQGIFVVLGLPSGTYEVEVTHTGFEKKLQEGVWVRAGQSVNLDIRLALKGVVETVQVKEAVRDIPIIDSSTPERKFNVSGEFMNRLPLSSNQNWDAVFFLLPGAITNGRGLTDTKVEANVNGASERAVTVKLDNFDVASAFTNQTWVTQFSSEVIEDIVIKTGGPDAATPLGSGAYVNIVTKSGGNALHGSAAMFWQPRTFNWSNIPGGVAQDQRLKQPDLSLGGPIKKDRLWYFLSYRKQMSDQGVPRNAAALAQFDALGVPRPTYDLQERNTRFLGKASYQMNTKNTFVFTYLNDTNRTLNSDSRDQSVQESAININNGGPAYTVQWTSNLTPRLLLNATYGYRRINTAIEVNGGDNPARVLYQSTIVSGGNLLGQTVLLYYGNRSGGVFYDTGPTDHHEVTYDVSTFRAGLWGSHQFQFGGQWKPRTRNQGTGYSTSTGQTSLFEVLRNGQRVPYYRRYQNPPSYPRIVGKVRLMAGYFQDKWTPHPRLTVNLGLRFDQQSSLDGFQVERLNTVSPSPRAGLALRLNKSGRDVVRASWSRIYDPVYVQLIPGLGGSDFLGSRSPDIREEWDNDLNGTYERVLNTPGTGIFAPPQILGSTDPNAHASFVDEWQFGYARQLPWRFVADATYFDRKFKEAYGRIDRNIIYQGGLFRGYQNPAVNAITQVTNLANAYQRYRSVQLSLTRNAGTKLNIFTSYTYQKQEEIGTFQYDSVLGYLNPSDWFYTDKVARPHIFRFNANYQLPWGFTVAAIFQLQSGRWGGPLTKSLAAVDPAFGPSTLTLSNGRVVANPLATVSRLVGPRGQGQLRLPAQPRLNVRFGKEFKIAERHTIEANADFYNIANDGTPSFFLNGANTSLPTFGQAQSATQTPRGAELSVRWRF